MDEQARTPQKTEGISPIASGAHTIAIAVAGNTTAIAMAGDSAVLPKPAEPTLCSNCSSEKGALKKDDVPQWPLWWAGVPLVVGFILVYLNRKNPTLDLVILVTANSFAQMSLDFFKGKSKPIFSALARGLPIAIGVVNYYWP